MNGINEIVLFQPDETVKLEVILDDETVWLTQAQMMELFQSSKANISEHIKHVFDEGELVRNVVVRKFRTTTQSICQGNEPVRLECRDWIAASR